MRVTTLSRLSRRLGTAALVLAIGVGVSACSDDSGSSDSSSSATDESAEESPSADAEEAQPEETEPAETEATAEASLAELSADDFYPSVMAAMQEAETFNFATTSGAAGQAQDMAGQARYGTSGIEMKASSTGAQAIELILLGKAMYLKSPDLGTGDKWIKIDLSDPNSLFGMIGKAVDPEVMFKALERPKKLELIGSEEVDGVETNHYRITLDPAQYLDAMDFPAAMTDMLPKELVTEMWVDADNLPRKFAQTLDMPAAGGGAATSQTTEGTYSDFGTDVEIEAPPASDVTEDFPGA